MKKYLPYLTLFELLVVLFAFTTCHSTDTTKIIQPTDYQISTVSMSLPREVVATNMAAQPISDDDDYTLVGALLNKGTQRVVGLWLFNKEDPSFVKSVNQEAVDNSPFPVWEKTAPIEDADNLTAFLTR